MSKASEIRPGGPSTRNYSTLTFETKPMRRPRMHSGASVKIPGNPSRMMPGRAIAPLASHWGKE